LLLRVVGDWAGEPGGGSPGQVEQIFELCSRGGSWDGREEPVVLGEVHDLGDVDALHTDLAQLHWDTERVEQVGAELGDLVIGACGAAAGKAEVTSDRGKPGGGHGGVEPHAVREHD